MQSAPNTRGDVLATAEFMDVDLPGADYMMKEVNNVLSTIEQGGINL